VTNESALKGIFVAVNVLNGTGILKRINSSSHIRENHYEIHNSRPQKFNSISKTKRVIKAKEIENEPLVLVKNTTNYNALQIAIIEKLKDEKYKQEELINDLIELIEKCPIINKFTDMRLFKKEDFDIFIETNDEKFLFILNLHNMMNIVNLLWFYSKKNSEHFLNLLDKLGIYFSYVKRKEDTNSKIIDVVLLTKIPLNLYNYISNYSDREFDNTKLKEMAKSLGVSSAFLSAVENGKKQVPKTWYERISSIYELALKEKEKLKNAIEESKKMLVLNLENATQANKEFALVFARSFEELTDEERKKIQGILTKKRGKKNA